MRGIFLALVAVFVSADAGAQVRPPEQRDGIVCEAQQADGKGALKGRWKNDNSVCKIVTFHFEIDGKKQGSDYQVVLNARESKPMEYTPTSSTHWPRVSRVETCS